MAIANVFNDEGGTGKEIGAETVQSKQTDNFDSLCNGSNTQFTTTKDITDGSLSVYLNGLKQGTTTISIIDDRNFAFSTPPLTGDSLEAVYNTPSE